MSCGFCGKEEKSPGADKGQVLICSHCVGYFSTLDRDQVRELIDMLYLSDKTEKAELLEKFVTGFISTARQSQVKLKVRTVAFKGLKPRFV
jgi:hypothetical protein